MHGFLVCAHKCKVFAQSQKNYARSHDRETKTIIIRNSVQNCGRILILLYKLTKLRHSNYKEPIFKAKQIYYKLCMPNSEF